MGIPPSIGFEHQITRPLMRRCPLALPLLAATATISSSVARDLVPEYWLEDLTATDGSIQKCLVFRTVAGVDYQVEASNDLLEWNDDSELYGLGHEFALPVHEMTPPPPPRAERSTSVQSGHQDGVRAHAEMFRTIRRRGALLAVPGQQYSIGCSY